MKFDRYRSIVRSAFANEIVHDCPRCGGKPLIWFQFDFYDTEYPTILAIGCDGGDCHFSWCLTKESAPYGITNKKAREQANFDVADLVEKWHALPMYDFLRQRDEIEAFLSPPTAPNPTRARL